MKKIQLIPFLQGRLRLRKSKRCVPVATQAEWHGQVSSPERPACRALAGCAPSQVAGALSGEPGQSMLSTRGKPSQLPPAQAFSHTSVPSQMPKYPLLGSEHSHCPAKPQPLLPHEDSSNLWPVQGPMASCAASPQCPQHAGTSVSSLHPGKCPAHLCSLHTYIIMPGGRGGRRKELWVGSKPTGRVCTQGWDLGQVLSLLRLNDEREMKKLPVLRGKREHLEQGRRRMLPEITLIILR